MIDVVIFAVIAAVLVFKLWSQLGKRSDGEGGFNGFGFPSETKTDSGDMAGDMRGNKKGFTSESVIDAEFADIPAKNDYSAYGDAEQGLQDIKAADGYFNPEEFLKGAEIAFEMILQDFATGNKESLQPLLGKDLYERFETAIDDRIAKGHVFMDTLVGVDKITITDARLSRGTAIITVAIHSQQVLAVYDEGGTLIEGDEQSSVQKIDVWVFERKVKSKYPNWLLMAADVAN